MRGLQDRIRGEDSLREFVFSEDFLLIAADGSLLAVVDEAFCFFFF